MKMRFNICLIGCLAGMLLAGCTLRESAKVSAEVDQNFVNAYEAFEMSKNPQAKVASGDTVTMSEGVWLGNKSTLQEHKNSLPARFETDTAYMFLFLFHKTQLNLCRNTKVNLNLSRFVKASQTIYQYKQHQLSFLIFQRQPDYLSLQEFL